MVVVVVHSTVAVVVVHSAVVVVPPLRPTAVVVHSAVVVVVVHSAVAVVVPPLRDSTGPPSTAPQSLPGEPPRARC